MNRATELFPLLPGPASEVQERSGKQRRHVELMLRHGVDRGFLVRTRTILDTLSRRVVDRAQLGRLRGSARMSKREMDDTGRTASSVQSTVSLLIGRGLVSRSRGVDPRRGCITYAITLIDDALFRMRELQETQ